MIKFKSKIKCCKGRHALIRLVISLLLWSQMNLGKAQVKITPTVGVDFSGFRQFNLSHYTIWDTAGFNSNSLNLGLNLEYVISENISFTFRNVFSQHRLLCRNQLDFEFPGVRDMSFNRIRHSIEFTFSRNNFSISAGPLIDMYRKIRLNYPSGRRTVVSKNSAEAGFLVSVGYVFRNFQVNGGYAQHVFGFWAKNAQTLVRFKSSYSFFLTVGYSINLNGIFNTDKVVCPSI